MADVRLLDAFTKLAFATHMQQNAHLKEKIQGAIMGLAQPKFDEAMYAKHRQKSQDEQKAPYLTKEAFYIDALDHSFNNNIQILQNCYQSLTQECKYESEDARITHPMIKAVNDAFLQINDTFFDKMDSI